MIYSYLGSLFPDYLKTGDACQFIAPAAKHFCQGKGLDVGAGKWPLAGAIPIDITNGGNAMALPEGKFPYIFSSHCLEHLENPVAAIDHWKTRLKPNGVLFLYLPHPAMSYWLPQNNRRHLHTWEPAQIRRLLQDMGFVNVIVTEGHDAYWSFMAVGFMPADVQRSADATWHGMIEHVKEMAAQDSRLDGVLETFGHDAFRRSAVIEPEFWRIIRDGNFRGKRCVEIGTFNGITTIVLSRFFDEVVSIDNFPHTAKHAILKHSGVTNVRFVDVADNAKKAKVIADLEFDAAFSDGDHVNDTEADFALVERCGCVLFHEYWEAQRPVWDLVNRLRLKGDVRTDGRFALWRKR